MICTIHSRDQVKEMRWVGNAARMEDKEKCLQDFGG